MKPAGHIASNILVLPPEFPDDLPKRPRRSPAVLGSLERLANLALGLAEILLHRFGHGLCPGEVAGPRGFDAGERHAPDLFEQCMQMIAEPL